MVLRLKYPLIDFEGVEFIDFFDDGYFALDVEVSVLGVLVDLLIGTVEFLDVEFERIAVVDIVF